MYYWLTVFSPRAVNFSLGSLSTNWKYPHSQSASWNDFRGPSVQALPHPSRVSLARARSLFRPLLPRACYAGNEKPNLQIPSSRNSPLGHKPLRYLVLARQTFRRRKNLSSWLILSRLAGNVYSFFQPFHGLTMSKYYETAKIGGLTKKFS